MFSGFMLVAIAVLLAPLDTLAGRISLRDHIDPQTSLTLHPKVIQPSGKLTGLENGGDANQDPSLTSENNFINFCLTQKVPLTDGQQKVNGSCNPIPMGLIPAKNRQPSCKFVFPPNLDASLTEKQPFTVKMAVNNLITGYFANATVKYIAAPQNLDRHGIIEGHSHVVIQALPYLESTRPLDPAVFVFFKGLNAPAMDGILSTEVPDGLPAGAYRMCSINTSTNHQPVLVSVAQHGALDDCVYFTVNPNSQGANYSRDINKSIRITSGNKNQNSDREP